MTPYRELGVISVNRNDNTAYIWYSQNEPYWANNFEIKLDYLENLVGCTFKDGKLPYWAMFHFYEPYPVLEFPPKHQNIRGMNVYY